ncbi:MAG: hypothetical protein ABFR89_05315 [Actinomycetota bacterium]
MDRRSAITLVVIAAIVVVVATTLSVVGDDGPPVATTATTATTAATSTSPTNEATGASTTTMAETTTAPPSTLPAGTTVCDRYEVVTVAGAVASSGLVEASGMAASRLHPDVLWAHNDSRDGARAYAIGPEGDDLGSFDLAGALAFDWEDMAAAPGPDPETTYLFFGDIGDNFAIRGGEITTYRVPEPDYATLSGPIEGAVPLHYAYPDGTYNAEALFVTDGSLYVVTKDRDETRVYRGDATGDGSATETLELVVTLHLDAEVSGADVSWDQSTIAFRGYRTVWLWHRTPGETIADALTRPPCTAPSPDEIQGESIAFLTDGAYATVSEGSNPLLHVVAVGP